MDWPTTSIITTSIYTHGNTNSVFFLWTREVFANSFSVWPKDLLMTGFIIKFFSRLYKAPHWSSVACFQQVSWKSKETVMWKLWNVLAICASKCAVSMCDGTSDLEIVATAISVRKAWSGLKSEWLWNTLAESWFRGCILSGLHSKDAVRRRLTQFEGSFVCCLKMRPSFPGLWRIERVDPSQPNLSKDSLHASDRENAGLHPNLNIGFYLTKL